MEVGLVRKIDIDQEMQQAYLDYAMSVIVARALPDARDGLKPVHRRILYAMYDMGLRPDSPFKKSARIVGEVLGKYHPHGDMAVYEAMARMAQDFSMRYLLVDGQGNFGSVDGDPPAAMRYTEARLAAPATHMLTDIAKNTVDFDVNFDATLTEPSVLPSAIPNLLVNGATGIAVGMATSIPPHNLGEVVDALQHMLQNWEKLDDLSVEDLMRFVQGPDFPTGGVILHDPQGDSLVSAYSTGRGQVTVQARAHLEEMERGRNRIIVTELPYMTNKASLIERIADLARESRLEGIVDLRDESDRQGMRIVIELNKTADPEAVLRDLYKHTPMQNTFSIIMLALVEGEPRLLSLKQALRVYIEHRLEIVRRRSQFDLEKARLRAHILEGLRVALKNLDELIDMIRRAPDVETARQRLMKRFKLSEIQAQAILDMQLRRLAALERKKIEDEYRETVALIKELEALLRSPKKMRQVVADELQAVKEAYGDRRRTHIVGLKEGQPKASLLTTTELVPDKSIWVSVTADGLISRSLDDKPPRQSGKDAPDFLVRASTRDVLYLVCEQGEAAALPVHALPETEDVLDGIPLTKASPLKDDQCLVAAFCLPARSGRNGDSSRFDEWHVLSATRQGMLKKSILSELPGASANTFTLVRVNEGDRLGWLRLSSGQNEILLVTARGMAICFSEEEIRPMGLVAAGVMGIKLQSNDEVIGMDLLPNPGEVFLVTDNGKAKRVATDQFPRQGRYGQGVVAWPLSGRERIVGMTIGKGTVRATLQMSKLLPRVIRLDEAPLQGRTARGKSIEEVKPPNTITRLCVPWESLFALQKVKADISSPSEALKRKRVTKVPVEDSIKIKADGTKPKKGTTPKASAKPGTARKTAKPAQKAETAARATAKPSGEIEAKKPASKKTAPAKASTPSKTAQMTQKKKTPIKAASKPGVAAEAKTPIPKKTTSAKAPAKPSTPSKAAQKTKTKTQTPGKTTGAAEGKTPAVKKTPPAKPSTQTSSAKTTKKTTSDKAASAKTKPKASPSKAQTAKGTAKPKPSPAKKPPARQGEQLELPLTPPDQPKTHAKKPKP